MGSFKLGTRLFLIYTIIGFVNSAVTSISAKDPSKDVSLPVNASVTVFTSTNDLVLLVQQIQKVTFIAQRNASETNTSIQFTIQFKIDDSNVVSITPDLVKVQINVGEDKVNFTVEVKALFAGKTTITGSSDNETIGVSSAFIRITVSHLEALNILSEIVGWIYFVAWSVSFYPQIYENWQRKSVIGLNFDFLGLNIIGFTLYGLFNLGLYFIGPIQAEYFERHPTGVNPVMLNDVIFALHAAFACCITIVQCCIYERAQQSVSRYCKLIMFGISLVLIISLILSLSSVLKWLDFLYICSYVKLFITLIKYMPQAYMNYQRKSTMGWSIGNVLLDFTGGLLSIAQMFIQSYNNNDWGSIFGDPTKFGLGLFSVVFDIFFMIQHYILYRNNQPSEPLINDQEYEDDRPSSDNEIQG